MTKHRLFEQIIKCRIGKSTFDSKETVNPILKHSSKSVATDDNFFVWQLTNEKA
jgi:hypothetical protein